MKKTLKNTWMLLLMLGVTFSILKANNIVTSNTVLINQVPGNYTLVQFDLNWDNSWKSIAGPGPVNWDAAYVFVKFLRTDTTAGCIDTDMGTWKHASLDTNASNYSIGNTNGVPATFSVALRSAAQGSLGKGVGVFIYRTGAGTGSINWDDVQLRWRYVFDGICDNDKVSVKVFAIEMVYVPQEAFYVGDGTSTSIRGHFEAGTSGSPFQVTVEKATITLGGGGAGSLGNNNRDGAYANNSYRDDFDDATSQTLPIDYPKGYDAFYCMKYECSQEQYMEFLNTLTTAQLASRTTANTAGEFHWANNQYVPNYRNGIKCQVPGLFRCDLDDDDNWNETTVDGRYIACNYVSPIDGLAYMDWAGLRPMTELEKEKICRGNQSAIANEYAWGNMNMHTTSYWNLTNPGGIDELPNNPDTTTLGNCVTQSTVPWNTGLAPLQYNYSPLRCGIFATATSNRITSGGTFYGIMEMTGNVWEIFVGLAHNSGRAFTGEHGDGALNANGEADEDHWPGINGNSTQATPNALYGGTTGCTRGAGFGLYLSHCSTPSNNINHRVSDRYYSSYGLSYYSTRYSYSGFRGIRTAP